MIRKFKKENGGYALLYVMVVIVLVCAIVMAICTSAMENYKAQQDSVAQMQAKYDVMGEVEKKLAMIQAEEYSIPAKKENGESYSDAKVAYKGYLETIIGEIDVTESENPYEFTLQESSADGTVTVTVTAIVEVIFSDDSDQPDDSDKYVVKNPNLKILSYTLGEGME